MSTHRTLDAIADTEVAYILSDSTPTLLQRPIVRIGCSLGLPWEDDDVQCDSDGMQLDGEGSTPATVHAQENEFYAIAQQAKNRQTASIESSPGVGAVRRQRRHVSTEQVWRRPGIHRPSLSDLTTCSVR